MKHEDQILVGCGTVLLHM